jgi:hypothetical protein
MNPSQRIGPPHDTRMQEPLALEDRYVRGANVAFTDQPIDVRLLSGDRLLQGIEHKACRNGASDPLADDEPTDG